MRKVRPVIATDKDGNETYYAKVSDGAKAVGIVSGNISRACIMDCWCKGYKWRYADED